MMFHSPISTFVFVKIGSFFRLLISTTPKNIVDPIAFEHDRKKSKKNHSSKRQKKKKNEHIPSLPPFLSLSLTHNMRI